MAARFRCLRLPWKEGAERLGQAQELITTQDELIAVGISLLERAYKTTLMTRHVDGIRLTREGLLVL